MPCKFPVRVYRSYDYNMETGKRPLESSPRDGFEDMPVYRPCGQCIGCRIDRAREWSIRIMHEASLHPVNSFITLTYDDDHLQYQDGAVYPTINKRTLQLFVKRLRRKLEPLRIRHYSVGEYGEHTARPHYHMCLFGCNFSDTRTLYNDAGSNRYYKSDYLDAIWGLGNCIIGDLEFDSANYVAGYVTKKLTGQEAAHYDTHKIAPPFALSSRNPGIGYDWIDQWFDDVYPRDFVMMNGTELKPPKYYDDYCRKHAPDVWKEVYANRIRRAYAESKKDKYQNKTSSAYIIENKKNAKKSKL